MWQYSLEQDYEDMKQGKKTQDQQEKLEQWGYSCDLCCAEVSYFEMMYHSKCDESGNPRDYCLSCIYSIVLQHADFQEILDLSLNNYLHDDAILEIVAFCVGSVS